MSEESQNTQPPANQMVTKIIWGALTFSQLIYLFVAFFVVEPPEQPPEQMMSIIFFGIGCSNIALGVFGVEKFVPVKDLGTYTTQHIIKWAVIESGVIFGLVSKFQGGPDAVMIGLYVLALLGMIKTFPKEYVPQTDSNSEEG
jgi:hypothetical protein